MGLGRGRQRGVPPALSLQLHNQARAEWEGEPGGGVEAGAGSTAATLELTLSASPSPTATAADLLSQPSGVSPQKPRGADRVAQTNCNGEKRRRSRGRASGRARAGEVRSHVTPEPRPLAAALPLDAGPAREVGGTKREGGGF